TKRCIPLSIRFPYTTLFRSDLADAAPRQVRHLTAQRLEPPRPEAAAHLRNHAKRARVIAAFSDFDVGGVPRRGQEPRREFVIERSEEHTSELQSLAYLVCRL